MSYVALNKTADGNLRITLTHMGRAHFNEIEQVRAAHGIDAALLDLLEEPLQNGWAQVRPEEISALTSALIISDETEWDDYGELMQIGRGRVYWNPRYQVEDEIETLLSTGELLWEGVV